MKSKLSVQHNMSTDKGKTDVVYSILDVICVTSCAWLAFYAIMSLSVDAGHVTKEEMVLA